MTDNKFDGFPRETITFFKELAKNNDKAWFAERKPDYERYVLEPARSFVTAMGEKLQIVSPDIVADPRINGSLFRIYRDTRFSKDKTPFKTHMGVLFWEDMGKRMEVPGFYFHIEPPDIMLAAGSHSFTKQQLVEYRKSVDHKERGPALEKIVADLEKKGYWVGGQNYKRVPRGFDKDHPRAELLKFGGLYAFTEMKIPAELYTRKLPDFNMKRWKDMAPLHYWLVDMTRRA